ncbi:MAG: amidohydrolase family protein [Planctomycetota bacterium]
MPTLYRAAAVADGAGVAAAPGAVLARGREIVAAGAPASIGAVADARRVDLPRAVIVPALVNAHCHLDLSHIGPIPYGGDFAAWLETVRAGRHRDASAIHASVQEGVRLSEAGGTCLVGDVAGAGSPVPARALRAGRLGGVSYVEVFGLGTRQAAAIETLRAAVAGGTGPVGGVRTGLQPHAPYSCGPEVYRAAAALGGPVATHLAETPAEVRFCRHGDGPLADLLRRLGVAIDGLEPAGAHPIDLVASIFADAPLAAAHVNELEDRHLDVLAGVPVTVVYCPRASAYFGHAGHRYRDMLDASIDVALGTDGLVCLPTPDRISVLDEMRLLHARDGTDPRRLLRMATVAGARGLGLDPGPVTLAPGPTAGLLALETGDDPGPDPLRAALRRDDLPRWLVPAGGPAAG